jgi:hypothetical protein
MAVAHPLQALERGPHALFRRPPGWARPAALARRRAGVPTVAVACSTCRQVQADSPRRGDSARREPSARKVTGSISHADLPVAGARARYTLLEADNFNARQPMLSQDSGEPPARVHFILVTDRRALTDDRCPVASW